MEVPVHVEIPGGTELKKQSMTSTKITVDVYTVKEFKLTPHVVGKLDDKDFISDLKIVPEKSSSAGRAASFSKSTRLSSISLSISAMATLRLWRRFTCTRPMGRR